MKRRFVVIALVAALGTGVVTPLSVGQVRAASHASARSVASHTQAFDKTKFLFHLGAAYFAFHHWVYKPYKDGKFTSGNRLIRGVRYVKAGIAVLFAYHEVKKAYDTAKNSNSKVLHIIILPMEKLMTAFETVGNKLKHGQYTSSDITNLNSQADSFQTLAKSNGFGFTDQTVSVPGA